MPTREFCIAVLAAIELASIAHAQAQGPYGIGREETPAEIAGWNIDIDRDGNNLPPGSGSVSRGRVVFEQQCASCHGAKGEGGIGDRLVGGKGSLATPDVTMNVQVAAEDDYGMSRLELFRSLNDSTATAQPGVGSPG